MLHFLKLIRYQNLLMIAFMQLIFRYGFLKIQNVPVSLALADWQYVLFVLSTVCIAAGGYIINNIMDQETDSINKPENLVVGKYISESSAYNYYIVLNIIGVCIGFYLSNVINKPNFAAIFIIITATLYFYATNLKQTFLVGNVIVALMLALSVIMIGLFDLLPATYEENRPTMGMFFSILLDYAIFTFILNFIREIIKDLEDVKGDYNQGMNTLPIVLGVARTSKIVFGLSFIPIICVVLYINTYFFTNGLLISTLYGLIFIVSPLIYFSVKIWSAEKPKDFKHLSLMLKWILLFGILSILVISLNMKQYA